MRSRIASPRRFSPKTVTLIARPGKKIVQGAASSACTPAVSIPPHEGSSGGAPIPMKLSAASTTMA